MYQNGSGGVGVLELDDVNEAPDNHSYPKFSISSFESALVLHVAAHAQLNAGISIHTVTVLATENENL